MLGLFVIAGACPEQPRLRYRLQLLYLYEPNFFPLMKVSPINSTVVELLYLYKGTKVSISHAVTDV